jgi:hypothetical protein
VSTDGRTWWNQYTPLKLRCGGYNEQSFYRGPSIDASYQVSVHLAMRFQRRRFLKIRNKNCLWRPCLLMDRDEMSNLYRGPSIDASYQVSVHLAEGFQTRRLKCEKLTDDRRRQKLTLPLARWAKNEHVPQKTTIQKKICNNMNLNPKKFNNKKVTWIHLLLYKIS